MSGAYVQARGLDEVMERLRKLSGSIRNPAPHLRPALPQFVGAIKRNFAAGGRPAKWQPKSDGSASHLHKTGRLVGSIQGRVEGDVIKIGTGAIYAAIHHFGGKTAPHVITPKRASVLAFPMGGKTVFAKKVNHPGSNYPARPFLVIDPEEKKIGLRIIADSIERSIK